MRSSSIRVSVVLAILMPAVSGLGGTACSGDDGTGGTPGGGDGTGNNPDPNNGGGSNTGGDGTGISNGTNTLPYSSNSASAVTALPNTGSGDDSSLPIFPMALFLAAAVVAGIGFGLRRRAL